MEQLMIPPSMTRTFGHSAPVTDPLASELRLQFVTANLPLTWSDCSTTANFLSSYYAGVLRGEYTPAQITEVTHSIAYLANELIENAVKFRTEGDVDLEAGLVAGAFLLRITNQIAEATSAKFQALLEEITAGAPGDLLIQRIEANAEAGDEGGSGLGLLTLMGDYGVQFSWSFTPAPDTGTVELETVARLPLPGLSPPAPSAQSMRYHGN